MQVRALFSITGLQLLMRSTTVSGEPDQPARRWFRRWSLWPPVLELPPWIRWVQASPVHTDRRVAGALIAAAAPLKPWINPAPGFPKHVIAGVHLVSIGPEGQSALDRDPDDPQLGRFGTRSYGDLSDAVVVIGELVRGGGGVVCEGLAYGLALACRRSDPVVVTFGCGGLVVGGNGVRPGAFRERHAGSLRIADRARDRGRTRPPGASVRRQ